MIDPKVRDEVSAAAKGRPRRGRITSVGRPGTGYAGFVEVTWRDGTTSWRMTGGLTLVRRPPEKIKEEEGARS